LGAGQLDTKRETVVIRIRKFCEIGGCEYLRVSYANFVLRLLIKQRSALSIYDDAQQRTPNRRRTHDAKHDVMTMTTYDDG